MTIAPSPSRLDGAPLDFAALSRIGRAEATVTVAPESMARVARGRAEIEAAIAAGVPVYGATTGVGAMKDVEMGAEDLERFNAGLVRAHHFGTGEPFPIEVVRAAIAIRVNTALGGRVGCSPTLVQAFVDLLNTDVTPVVRRTGSIGCADIGLMGQIGAVLIGAGEAFHAGRRLPADAALAAAGLTPIRLAPKDGLAAVSVNAVGYAAAARAARHAAAAVRVSLATGFAAAAAMGAAPDPWIAAVHVGTRREAEIGAWLADASAGSNIPVASHVQDPLSLRMIAQVFAVAFDTLIRAGRTLSDATGRPDDNPVVVNGRVLTSGGSLPLAVTMDMQAAALALAHTARNAFNRCVLIGNGRRRALPVNLVPPAAALTGLGPIVKLAGELFSRVLSLAQPISAQSLVVAAGLEDESAFLPLVVERFERQIAAVRRLSALEALLAAQAMDLMGDAPEGVAELIRTVTREHAAFYTEDRPLSADVEAVETALLEPRTMDALRAVAPLAEADAFFALDRPL